MNDDGFLDRKRDEIAAADREIMILLKKRLDITTEIGAYKAEHGLDARNLAVEQKVVQRYRKLAEELGMDPDRTEIICRIIMQESVAGEAELIKRREIHE